MGAGEIGRLGDGPKWQRNICLFLIELKKCCFQSYQNLPGLQQTDKQQKGAEN